MAEEAKGFSGLSARVSDVGGDIARLSGFAAPEPAPRPSASAATQPAPQDDGAVRKLLIVGAVVVGVIVLIVVNSGGSTNGPETAAIEPEAVAPVALPAAEAVAEAVSVELIQETEPPMADGLALDVNQIAYCLAQKVRVEAARSAAGDSLDADIDRFNAMVDSYNGKCGHYRYQQSDYDRAKTYVDERRADLEREGAAPFSTSEPIGSADRGVRSADHGPAALEDPPNSEQPQ